MSTIEKRDQVLRSAEENREPESHSKAVHPVCQFAPDKQRCERFVERLTEASDNIDRAVRR